eukprot:403340814
MTGQTIQTAVNDTNIMSLGNYSINQNNSLFMVVMCDTSSTCSYRFSYVLVDLDPPPVNQNETNNQTTGNNQTTDNNQTTNGTDSNNTNTNETNNNNTIPVIVISGKQSNDDGGGVPTSAIVIIVIGVLILVIIMGCVGFYFYKRHKKNQNLQNAAQNDNDYPEEGQAKAQNKKTSQFSGQDVDFDPQAYQVYENGRANDGPIDSMDPDNIEDVTRAIAEMERNEQRRRQKQTQQRNRRHQVNEEIEVPIHVLPDWMQELAKNDPQAFKEAMASIDDEQLAMFLSQADNSMGAKTQHTSMKSNQPQSNAPQYDEDEAIQMAIQLSKQDDIKPKQKPVYQPDFEYEQEDLDLQDLVGAGGVAPTRNQNKKLAQASYQQNMYEDDEINPQQLYQEQMYNDDESQQQNYYDAQIKQQQPINYEEEIQNKPDEDYEEIDLSDKE